MVVNSTCRFVPVTLAILLLLLPISDSTDSSSSYNADKQKHVSKKNERQRDVVMTDDETKIIMNDIHQKEILHHYLQNKFDCTNSYQAKQSTLSQQQRRGIRRRSQRRRTTATTTTAIEMQRQEQQRILNDNDIVDERTTDTEVQDLPGQDSNTDDGNNNEFNGYSDKDGYLEYATAMHNNLINIDEYYAKIHEIEFEQEGITEEIETTGSNTQEEELTDNKTQNGEEEHSDKKHIYHHMDHPVVQQRKQIAVPFFFHIPKAGGSSLQSLVEGCFDLVSASQIGGHPRFGHDKDDHLQIIELFHGRRFVNVDTSHPGGIDHAIDIGFVGSSTKIADVVLSPMIMSIEKFFNADDPAVLFALFRHPIKREISLFYYLQYADWEPTYHPEWQNWTIADYVDSGMVEENWITRFIIGKRYSRDVTDEDLSIAKEIIRNKFLIGLVDDYDNSVIRFSKMFGWDSNTADGQEHIQNCIHNEDEHPTNSHEHPHYDENSNEWNMLRPLLEYDLQLYEYVVELYREQGIKYDF